MDEVEQLDGFKQLLKDADSRYLIGNIVTERLINNFQLPADAIESLVDATLSVIETIEL